MRDPQLVDNIAAFVDAYRKAGRPPELTQRAALDAFPTADGTAYALALVRSNIRRSKAERALAAGHG